MLTGRVGHGYGLAGRPPCELAAELARERRAVRSTVYSGPLAQRARVEFRTEVARPAWSYDELPASIKFHLHARQAPMTFISRRDDTLGD